jgi:hypothetical protein
MADRELEDRWAEATGCLPSINELVRVQNAYADEGDEEEDAVHRLARYNHQGPLVAKRVGRSMPARDATHPLYYGGIMWRPEAEVQQSPQLNEDGHQYYARQYTRAEWFEREQALRRLVPAAPPTPAPAVEEAQPNPMGSSTRGTPPFAPTISGEGEGPKKQSPPPAPGQEEPSAPEKTPDDRFCVICLDSPKIVAAVPCGHVCACVACAAAARPKMCPVCRTPVTQMMRIFL